MKIGYYIATVDYGWRYLTPSVEYRHRYWYLWEISLSWWKWSIVIELCRKDWNKVMKANELDGKDLMVGNFVYGCIETDVVGEATYKILCKVTDVNYYGDVRCEALEPFPDELDWQDGDYFSWIEPIPLTAEMLSKLGFKKKGNRYGIYDDYFDFEMHEYNDGIWVVSYHCCEMSLPDEQLLICYIHQLQHFMRHCGIDKTIEL